MEWISGKACFTFVIKLIVADLLRSKTGIVTAIHNRNWRVHALVWEIEHETVMFQGRKENARRFPSSWRRYHGQLPLGSSP